MDITPVIVGLSMVGTFALVLGFIFHGIDQKKKAAQAALEAARAAAPTTWVSTGVTPPEGWETALGVIRKAYDKLPSFGTIEWAPGPYTIPPGIWVAGHVVSFDPPHIKLMATPLVENSAFAHEMLHLDDSYRYGRDARPRESPQDRAFVAEFIAVNALIAKALGR